MSAASAALRSPGRGPLSSSVAIQAIRRRSADIDHGLFSVGVEILPYEIVAAIVDSNGAQRSVASTDLVSMDVGDVVTRLTWLVRDLVIASLGMDLTDSRLCIGVQLGGPVDSDTGVVRYYANNPHDHGRNAPPYEWIDVDLADQIERASGCVTVLDNDAHAYAAFEQRLGAGRCTGQFAVVLIRHGVGAGVVTNHQLQRIPMEFGHLLIWPSGRPCDCTRIGCIESQAGRRAIPAVVAEKTSLVGDSFDWAVQLANGGHPLAGHALTAFAEAGASIARGVATLLTLFGPRQVVIYGPDALVVRSSGRAANVFLDQVDSYSSFAFRHLGRECRITTETLDPTVGAHGAGLIALNRHFGIPLEPHMEDADEADYQIET